ALAVSEVKAVVNGTAITSGDVAKLQAFLRGTWLWLFSRQSSVDLQIASRAVIRGVLTTVRDTQKSLPSRSETPMPQIPTGGNVMHRLT
ncbi:hypothetical protein ACC736_38020, partial [Rhizobium ruizarguesonis]